MNEQEEKIFLENCSDEDALAFNSGMFKAGNVREKIWLILINSIGSILYTKLKEHNIDINPGHLWKWFKQGIECEILKVGSQGWQKGKLKLKVCLEFIPDEPKDVQINELKESTGDKSVLDDIRQSIV